MPDQDIASAYLGTKGEAYFWDRSQDRLMHLGYRLQARFYFPFLRKDTQVLGFGCGNGSMATLLSEDVTYIKGIEVKESDRQLPPVARVQL